MKQSLLVGLLILYTNDQETGNITNFPFWACILMPLKNSTEKSESSVKNQIAVRPLSLLTS